ncbi:DUF4177 domain-containing protein [Aestuariibius sp. 2305UL40-4]|uniref:DUF4177 domain-containing protein n=1 Tax=Aestuariibius violaceus TaxID=3234132 RepID=UPI00345EBE5B
MIYEYRVVPAPRRGLKGKGVKGPEARFAHALETVMNEEAADGWEYVRTDTLPAEERQGLTSRTTVYQNVLVFRRPRRDSAAGTEDDHAPAVLAIAAPRSPLPSNHDTPPIGDPPLTAEEEEAQTEDSGVDPNRLAATFRDDDEGDDEPDTRLRADRRPES